MVLIRLVCPVLVAERGRDNSEFIPLIKSSDRDLPQDSQDTQDKQF